MIRGRRRALSSGLGNLAFGDFAILNPGAGWGAKRWPAERYGEVARKLADLGLGSILNYGPGEEELVSVAEAASAETARAMSCTNHGIDCVDAAGAAVYWRRHGAAASGGGVAGSGGGDLWAYGSGAQRAVMGRAVLCCVVRRVLPRMRGGRRRMRGCWRLGARRWWLRLTSCWRATPEAKALGCFMEHTARLKAAPFKTWLSGHKSRGAFACRWGFFLLCFISGWRGLPGGR